MTISAAQPDLTGYARKSARTATSDLGGHHSTPDGVTSPSGPEIPSRVAKSSWHDRLTPRQRLDEWAREPHPIADSRFGKFVDDVRLLLAEQVVPLADMGLDAVAEAEPEPLVTGQDRAVVMLAIKLADAEADLEDRERDICATAADLDALGDRLNAARRYTQAEWQAARDAVFERYYDPTKPAQQRVTLTTGDLVDTVAKALGMERAW